MLVSGNTANMKRYLEKYPVFENHLGVLHTPTRGLHPFKIFSAADNDAFTGFNQKAYMNMLPKLVYLNVSWVTCPDIVGDAKETLRLYYKWQPVVSGYRLPCAFVAQDGIEDTEIPWSLLDCIFIGGTTYFKYSKVVIDLIAEAKKHKKLVHVGRVNTVERIRYFFPHKPDSFDGSGYSRYTDKIIRDLITILDLKRG